MTDLSRLSSRLHPHSDSVFGEYSALATRLGAINLGQGFPDTDGPQLLKDIAIAAIKDGTGNQYPPRNGIPDLLAAVAEHQQRFYGLRYQPDTDVVIGTGASELITATLLAFLEPGDEVIVAEPWFDVYGAAIALAHAVQVNVPMTRTPTGFTLLATDIAAVVTPRTKLLILNTPHNPTGAVLDRQTLHEIADIARQHDLLVLSDEVYEHMVFDDRQHVPMATVPGMFERTVTLGSGGKSFSMTGWKIGWATGPAALIAAVRVVRQHLSYVSGGPFQPAIAAGLRLPDSYFNDLAAGLQQRRDLLTGGLADAGLAVIPTTGTYFVLTDVTPLGYHTATDFLADLAVQAGVVAIPVSRLTTSGMGSQLVRWTFCKQPAVLSQAVAQILQAGLGR